MAYWMLDAKGDPTMAHERCAKVTWSGAAPTAGEVCAALAPFGDVLECTLAPAHAVVLFRRWADRNAAVARYRGAWTVRAAPTPGAAPAADGWTTAAQPPYADWPAASFAVAAPRGARVYAAADAVERDAVAALDDDAGRAPARGARALAVLAPGTPCEVVERSTLCEFPRERGPGEGGARAGAAGFAAGSRMMHVARLAAPVAGWVSLESLAHADGKIASAPAARAAGGAPAALDVRPFRVEHDDVPAAGADEASTAVQTGGAAPSVAPAEADGDEPTVPLSSCAGVPLHFPPGLEPLYAS